MAIFSETIRSNGQKKTSQGMSHRTKWGTKPNTDSLFTSTKALKRYKKKYRGQGKAR